MGIGLFALLCLLASHPISAAQASSNFAATIPVEQLQVPREAMVELDKSARAYSTGNKIAARDHVERALRLSPTFARALAWRGIMNADEQKLDDSCADLEKAIENDPNLAWAYAGLGRSYNNMSRWEEADRVLQRALMLSPKLWQAEYEAARTAIGQLNFRAALQHVSRAEQLTPQPQREIASLKSIILQNISVASPHLSR